MRTAFPAIASALLLGASPALPAAPVFRGSAWEIRLTLPRVERGPAIDGVLDDPVWERAALLDSFTHVFPIEGVRDTIGTVCLVLYDDRNLYVGFRCNDDPRAIQAPIVTRDNIWQGDWVGISIDPYNDRQRSQFMCANAHGIQMDGVDPEGLDSDLAPDFLYTSEGRITPDGYEVEMAIPFTSLRFPNHNPLTFGFNAIRDIQRNGTHMFWAPVTSNKNSYNAQLGTLEGIVGVQPGKNLQVNPTFTGTRAGERVGGALRYEPDSRPGLDLKYGITSSLTSDVTVTPDFSQVEADAGVIDVNERFAIFFPEKRPFFLEGSDIFRTPISVVYTRRIVDPLYGAKLTGKAGKTEVGVLSASDRSDGNSIETLPDRLNPYLDHDALYSIVRMRRDLFEGSYVGLLAGERRQDETYNRGAGLDGRLRFFDQYSLMFQRIQSWSRGRDLRQAIAQLTPEERADLDEDLEEQVGEITSGDASSLEIARSSKGLDLGVSGLDISPRFAADMGFIRRTDQINLNAWVAPHIIGKENSWFTVINPRLTFDRTYDHGGRRRIGRRTDEAWEPFLEIKLPRNTWAAASYKRAFTFFDGREFADQNQFYFWAGSERFETVRGEVEVSFGENVIFDETVPGTFRKVEIESGLRFGRQLDADLTINAEQDKRRETGTRFAEVLIPRLRVSYQFNRELSLRWIGEIQFERQFDAAGSLDSQSHALSLDLLASYFVRPGTVVYLGYGSTFEGMPARAMTVSKNNVFLKLSYLWQG